MLFASGHGQPETRLDPLSWRDSVLDHEDTGVRPKRIGEKTAAVPEARDPRLRVRGDVDCWQQRQHRRCRHGQHDGHGLKGECGSLAGSWDECMRVSIPEHVYAETVQDETILLELASGSYYGLDRVGTRLWQLLSELQATEAVTAVACEEFDASPEELTGDIEALVRELADRGLLVVHASTTSPAD